jgi:hypothetical protein
MSNPPRINVVIVNTDYVGNAAGEERSCPGALATTEVEQRPYMEEVEQERYDTVRRLARFRR